MDLIARLHKKNLIKPPPFVIGGTMYLTIMGSFAYGVSGDDSDCDVYGFCIPPKVVSILISNSFFFLLLKLIFGAICFLYSSASAAQANPN